MRICAFFAILSHKTSSSLVIAFIATAVLVGAVGTRERTMRDVMGSFGFVALVTTFTTDTALTPPLAHC